MTKYEYTLRFALPTASTDMDAVADTLYGSGCDDALVGIGRPGSVALDFTRAAPSAREAMMSAISDVTRALPGATLIEAAPDFVGITDVADIVGCTRQNIRQLMAFGSSRVPAPVCEGRPALWHLSAILKWLVAEKRYQVDAALLDLADTTMRVNLALCALQAEPELEDDLRALLA
ncbi:MAG: DNA-binding protein [Coriobacteriia bacterium]|nr:DNA-binding protein [Coriobacteriia bacterium]